MILSYEEIISAIEAGAIHIDPYNLDLVKTNSVDIRLGHDLWKMGSGLRDLYDDDQQQHWIPCNQVPIGTIRLLSRDYAKALPPSTKMFYFEPGRFYLGTTYESIGTTDKLYKGCHIVPKIYAKSTMGRHGFTVAKCAGVGDVGYHGRWALEINVDAPNDSFIAIGTPVAQMVFTLCEPTEHIYTEVKGDGSRYFTRTTLPQFLPKPLSKPIL